MLCRRTHRVQLTDQHAPNNQCPMRDGFHYKFWVYILSSPSGTLYVGITGFFNRRIHQH